MVEDIAAPAAAAALSCIAMTITEEAASEGGDKRRCDASTNRCLLDNEVIPAVAIAEL